MTPWFVRGCRSLNISLSKIKNINYFVTNTSFGSLLIGSFLKFKVIDLIMFFALERRLFTILSHFFDVSLKKKRFK